MKVLFITPPNFRFRGASSKNMVMGPAYLVSVLKGKHDVANYDSETIPKDELSQCKYDHTSYDYLGRSHNMYVEGLKNEAHSIWKEIEGVVSDFSPHIVGLSTMTGSFPAALVVAKIVKRTNNAIVIMGGSHPSVLSEEVVNSNYVDFVVRGEGEETIVELVNCIERGLDPGEVRGITYKKDGRIIKTADRCFIEDLDKIPFPDKDAFLFPERFQEGSFSNILTGRGCPWRCYFCCNLALWGKRFRMRSSENIFNEVLAVYKRYGKMINFMDDNLIISKKTLFGVCKRIINEKLNILWRCQSHVDTLTEDILAICKDAGCWDITLGIESGSDSALSYLNKHLTIKKTMEAVEMILKNGIQLSVNFMFGFPEETWEDMQATLDLIKRIPANNIAISKFIPLPGTKLYGDVMALNLIKDNPPKYEHFDLYSDYYHYPLRVSRQQLKEFAQEVFQVVVEKNKKTRIGPPKEAALSRQSA